ncbi:tetratricopeptide repeat protein [Mucilaginibacter agri]|uniref:Tetratricopeptide repeat protein n=1 Tax=Mucilaginibacter agri TaxID=2695265 RepID=A0A966DVJ3_9SPHI|nr:tetratricopeptide repeat protein [Mucilaginibacter agri]NCD70599.1 tetratricopeptide repeat protein [Mucilaginibacter agri]
MKRLILIVFIAIVHFAQAQQQHPRAMVDYDFIFDRPFTTCEKKWVIFPKAADAKNYAFGYIYMDEQAGFTFRLQGAFYIDEDKNFILDSAATPKNSITNYRLESNTRLVALVPLIHYAQLKITAEPEWVKSYYTISHDEAYRDFRRGFNFNAARQCDSALVYLEKVYQKNPNYSGLTFEFVYACNELNQYDRSITILQEAIKNEPDNGMFYRELGYAYLGKKDYDDAITTYQKGIDVLGDKADSQKSEMAINLAQVYKFKGETDSYQEWGKKAKLWAPLNSAVYKHIVSLGF